MGKHYLCECRELLPVLTRKKYRRAQELRDLHEIEKRAAKIRESRGLTYEDIEIFTKNEFLDVKMFGYWPTQKEIADDLEKQEFDFRDLPGTEDQVIRDLQSTFHQIQLVSVILRFVDATNYGILSPPVEQILGIAPTRYHREKYRSYVCNLRTIREEIGPFSKAADVDVALWVLSVGVVNEELDDEHLRNRLKEEYENDPLLRELRVANLAKQLFGELNRRQLAEALNRCSSRVAQADRSFARFANELAGQIAGIEFERAIREALDTSPESEDGLKKMVCEVCEQRSLNCNQWENAVRIRNKLMHPKGQSKERWSADEVGRLVEAMEDAHRLS